MGGDVTYERHDSRTVFALSLPRVNLQSVRQTHAEDLVIDPFEGKPNEEALRRIIGGGGPKIAYQPIIDIASSKKGDIEVQGHEALARFPYAPPPVWFEAASAHGLRLDLELAAIAASVGGFTPETPGFLAVNLSDALLTSSRLRETLQGFDSGRVVLELSESAVIRNYEQTKRHIAAFQESGIRLAIDDVGATEIDLWHMLRLAPDFIKIDMSLVRDVHNEPRNRALIRGVAAMSDDLGIMVIAEGIESFQEEEKLLDIGVRYGQGYRYGKPGALQWKTRVLDSE
jgi:EAL domain-containing protein (putative c-di-GMP-specific phosphodiesterase class I)